LPTSAAALALKVVLRLKSLATRAGLEGRDSLADVDNLLSASSSAQGVGRVDPQVAPSVRFAEGRFPGERFVPFGNRLGTGLAMPPQRGYNPNARQLRLITLDDRALQRKRRVFPTCRK